MKWMLSGRRECGDVVYVKNPQRVQGHVLNGVSTTMSGEESMMRVAGTSAVVLPRILAPGQEFVVQLEGWGEFAGCVVDVHIGLTSPAGYLSLRPLRTQLDASGNGSVRAPRGLDVERLWGLHVDRLTCAGRELIPENNPASLVNWDGPILAEEETQQVYDLLRSECDALFASPIGDPTDSANRLHRVVSVLTGVLTTRHSVYPGLLTVPLDERPVDREHLDLVNGFLGSLKLPVVVDTGKWSLSKSNRYPSTAVLLPQVWAPDFEGAHRLALERIERLQLVLALNRLAKATPVALIIEQRQSDDTSTSRVYPLGTHYTGNLMGGVIAGESPEQLAAEFAGLESDPVARLGASLFAEALAETDEDFRFFKHWSALEVLSERYGDDGAVTLTSGEPWPEALRPLDPAPKVYSMVAKVLSTIKMVEGGLCAPATDLYELIQVLKARRNATAHYGRFDPADPAQQGRGWYAEALKSSGAEPEWLLAARNLNVMMLHFVLGRGPSES